jgi:hypothetical protein
MEPHCSLPCSQEPTTSPNPEPDASSPYLSVISILILSSHLCVGLCSVFFFLLTFHQNHICIPFIVQTCYTPCPSHPLSVDHSDYIWWRVQVMKLLITQYCPASQSILCFSHFSLKDFYLIFVFRHFCLQRDMSWHKLEWIFISEAVSKM